MVQPPRPRPCCSDGSAPQVLAIFDRPDGKNINLDCGSQHPEALGQRVLEVHAHVGLAFDGDGDRLISVDERGTPLTGDQTLAIFARMLKDQGRLEKDLVVSTVMSNLGLRLALEGFGVSHAETQVGDRHVLEEMLKRGAILGGEDSGHMIFLRHHTTGDGLLSALQMAVALKTFREPLSALRHLMKVFPQKTVNVPVRSKPDLSIGPGDHRGRSSPLKAAWGTGAGSWFATPARNRCAASWWRGRTWRR